MCRDDASEASHAVDERASTYRLLEPISHPSRAEDLDDLRRLQKSSTKPRKGEHAGGSLPSIYCPAMIYRNALSLVTRPANFANSQHCRRDTMLSPALLD